MNTNSQTIESGKHYWYRQVHDQTWRTCYIGEDPDHNQYLWITGVTNPWEIAKMDLEFFEFREIPRPEDSPADRVMAMEKETFQRLVVLKGRLYSRETGLSFDETRILAQTLDHLVSQAQEIDSSV